MIYLIPFIAVYFVALSGIAGWLTMNLGVGKPFNCEHCLSIWLTIIYGLYNHLPFDYICITAGINAVTSIILLRIITLILNFLK